MMLRYTFGIEEAALRVEQAVKAVLAAGYRTGDIYEPGTRKVGTVEMGMRSWPRCKCLLDQ